MQMQGTGNSRVVQPPGVLCLRFISHSRSEHYMSYETLPDSSKSYAYQRCCITVSRQACVEDFTDCFI